MAEDVLIRALESRLDPRPEKLDPAVRNYEYPYPVLFRIVFINFLRRNFYGAYLGGYKYDPDETKTEVIIKDGHGDTETPGKRPAIMIHRGDLQALDQGYNNNLLTEDWSSDSSSHADLLITSLTVQCFEKNAILSEYLANLVFCMIRYHKKELNGLGIAKLSDFTMSAPQKSAYGEGDTETSPTTYYCNVSMQVFLQQSWKMRWKTREEMEEFIKRTGMDPTTSNIPPEILQGVETNINKK